MFWNTTNDDFWVPSWWQNGMRLWWQNILDWPTPKANNCVGSRLNHVADFWWAGTLEVAVSVGWEKICRIPLHIYNHYLMIPIERYEQCWEVCWDKWSNGFYGMLRKPRKWKMELTWDFGFRNQPSCCLFRTAASTGRLNNLKVVWRPLQLKNKCLC